MADKGIPTSRLGRIARLAGVGMRSGAGLLLSKTGGAPAEYAAEVLGTMRGLAAKIGQTLSYVDGVVPEAQREAYEKALGKLRDATPRSPPEAVVRSIESELQAPLGELFPTFEREPFASASIGQVHRAVLPDGRAVAVKVQHPGIADAVESDLKNARVMEALFSTIVPKGVDTAGVYREIANRFREELDYELEARHQQAFAELHRGDPAIHVPAVVSSHSRKCVLTTEFAEGVSFEKATTASESERAAWARTLWRFVFKGNLVGKMFNADPHPGNYIFNPDGRVTFLDFGCVQPLQHDGFNSALGMHLAALSRDETAFARNCEQLLGTRGGAYGERAVTFSRHCFSPLFESPFHVTRAYTTQLVDDIRSMKQLVWARDASFVMLPPHMVLLNRLQFGFYSVLARLDVRVDYADVERVFLTEAGLL